MKSKIYLSEAVENKDRKFGSSTKYFPAKIIRANGNETNALFTASQIQFATERAIRNPEDIPENLTFWERLFGKKEDNK